MINIQLKNKTTGEIRTVQLNSGDGSNIWVFDPLKNSWEYFYPNEWDSIVQNVEQKTNGCSLRDLLGQDVKTLEFK